MSNKKDWKKEAAYWKRSSDDYEDKYDRCSDRISGAGVLAILAMGMFIFSFFLAIGGVFDYAHDELGLDDDKLTRAYVLEFYPEYENCTIRYNSDIDRDTRIYSYRVEGADIYCDGKPNDRDGMKVFEKNNPTLSLELDDVYHSDMLEYLVRDLR